MFAIETKKLEKKFGGVRAVDCLSLQIRKGTITSIVGPNGSGKTTFTNLLSGLIPRDGGSIAVHGVLLKKISPWEAREYGITRTFQNIRLFEQMSVEDNIMVVLTERSAWGALTERRTALHVASAEAALKRVGMWEKRHALAEMLSYGQRKLIEIARAYAVQADISLFDEPFAGLFPEMIKIIVSVLEELRKAGKTIILVEHNMDLIRTLSDHVVVLDAGKFLAEGLPDEVLARREVIGAYLGQ